MQTDAGLLGVFSLRHAAVHNAAVFAAIGVDPPDRRAHRGNWASFGSSRPADMFKTVPHSSWPMMDTDLPAAHTE